MSHEHHSHHRRSSHGHHHAGRRHSWHDERRRSSAAYDFERDRVEFLERRVADMEYDRRRSSISEAPSYEERRASMDSGHHGYEHLRVGKKIVVVIPKPEPIKVTLQQPPPPQQPCQKILTPVAPRVTPQPCQKIVPPPPPPSQAITPSPPPCQAIIPPLPEPKPPVRPKKEVVTVGTGESMLQIEPVPRPPATVTEDQQTTMSLYPIIETYESVYLDAPMRPEDDPEPDPFQLDEPGLCESCHKGYYVRKFTWSGIVAALFCFPCGIAVCFCSRVWVCNHCGEHPEHPKPELYDSAATIRKQASKATKAASRAASKARSTAWRSRNRVAPDDGASAMSYRRYENR